jgi:hypothetical protein
MKDVISTKLEDCGHDHSTRASAGDHIMPAECVGVAKIIDGVLDVGGLKIELGRPGYVSGLGDDDPGLAVYVRRLFHEGSVFDVALSFGDGLAQEELDNENDEAQNYPLGVKEYWRKKEVGNYLIGTDRRVMTDLDFEIEWAESEAEYPEADYPEVAAPRFDPRDPNSPDSVKSRETFRAASSLVGRAVTWLYKQGEAINKESVAKIRREIKNNPAFDAE